MEILLLAAILTPILSIIPIAAMGIVWRFKLKWTLQANQIERQMKQEELKHDVKIAKLKHPQPKTKRMPQNWVGQLKEFIDLLGNDQVRDVLNVLSGKEEEISEDNKLLQQFLPLAKAFIGGMAEGQEQLPAVRQNY